jgi:hypothetical protein
MNQAPGGFMPASGTTASPTMSTSPTTPSRYGTSGSTSNSYNTPGYNGGGYNSGTSYNNASSSAGSALSGPSSGIQQVGAYTTEPTMPPSSPGVTARKQEMTTVDYSTGRSSSDMGGRGDVSGARNAASDNYGASSMTPPAAPPSSLSSSGNGGRLISTDMPTPPARPNSTTGSNLSGSVPDVLPPAPPLTGNTKNAMPVPDQPGAVGDALSNPPPPVPQTSMSTGTRIQAGPDVGNSLIPPSK